MKYFEVGLVALLFSASTLVLVSSAGGMDWLVDKIEDEVGLK